MPKAARAGTRNGDGSVAAALEGSPWYVKAVIYLLAWFGFPVAVSVVLLMVVIGYIPSPLTTLDKNMTLHVKDMERVLQMTEVNQRVMRQICRNTSRDAVERVECDR